MIIFIIIFIMILMMLTPEIVATKILGIPGQISHFYVEIFEASRVLAIMKEPI